MKTGLDAIWTSQTVMLGRHPLSFYQISDSSLNHFYTNPSLTHICILAVILSFEP